MARPVISVEHLSKAYRIGLKEEIPDTFVGAMTGWMKAPLRNWRRLRRLDVSRETAKSRESRVESREQEAGQETRVKSQEQEDRGQTSEVGVQSAQANGQRTTDNGQPSNGHSDSQPSTLNPQPSTDLIWALHDVSFDVHEGEVVGIIGRNGAGKSTLLKILSRITEPTSGRAVIRGRVSSLLEVGTGFHPELTGRENIYMNGTILGMTKREIDRKFDEIVDFSGVEKFLDTPIKRYSSGMQVRLAFAVAAHLEPEILIVDEVLAVGDAEFQKKCLGKMQDVARGGRTVLFVSHQLAAVRSLCNQCLFLDSGRVLLEGVTAEIIDTYLRSLPNGTTRRLADRADRKGNGRLRFNTVRLLDTNGFELDSISSGDAVTIEIAYCTEGEISESSIIIVVSIDDHFKNRVAMFASDEIRPSFRPFGNCGHITIRIPRLLLRGGEYTLNLWASERDTSLRGLYDWVEGAAQLTVVRSDFYNSGSYNRSGTYGIMDATMSNYSL